MELALEHAPSANRVGALEHPVRRWLVCTVGVVLFVLACHAALRFGIERAGLRFGAVSATVAPLYAYVRPHLKGWLLLPLACLGTYSVLLRRSGFLTSWSARRFAATLYVLTLGVATTVAMLDGGPDRVVGPYTRLDLEYAGAVAAVSDPVEFLRTFPERAPTLPMHAQNHPPGAVLVLWAAGRVLGTGPAPLAWFSVAIAAVAAPLAYVAARAVAGEGWARRTAVLYSLLPSVVLFSATSMDGVFAVPLAGAFTTLLMRTRSPVRGSLLAGFSAGVALLMTYSAVWAGLWAAVYVVLSRGRLDRKACQTLAAFGLGMALPTGLLALVGYRPVDTFLTCVSAHQRIMAGTAHDHVLRWLGLSVGNLAAFICGAGLLVAAFWLSELPRGARSHRALWYATAVMVGLAAAVPIYTLEVERIWLFMLLPVVVCVSTGLSRLPAGQAVRLWRYLVWAAACQTLLTEIWLETYW